MLPRTLCTLSLLLLTVGCASTRPQPTASTTTLPATTRTYTQPGASYPASALVFDPPASRYLPPLDLSRNARQPMAFNGFQQATNTFTYTWTYDYQSTDFPDSYNRYSSTLQVGTSVR
jgi:hypothetical protein